MVRQHWADAAATRPARQSMNTSGCEKCKSRNVPPTFTRQPFDWSTTVRANGSGDDSMAFEYPTSTGIIELVQVRERWLLRCAGRSRGAWPSAEAAATAVAGHKTGPRRTLGWPSRRQRRIRGPRASPYYPDLAPGEAQPAREQLRDQIAALERCRLLSFEVGRQVHSRLNLVAYLLPRGFAEICRARRDRGAHRRRYPR
jgi:hypothetical protein